MKAVLVFCEGRLLPPPESEPMSEIIGRRGLPNAPFKDTPLCLEIVRFLTSIPWNLPVSHSP